MSLSWTYILLYTLFSAKMRLDGQRDVRPDIAGLGIKMKNVKHLKVISKVIGLQK